MLTPTRTGAAADTPARQDGHARPPYAAQSWPRQTTSLAPSCRCRPLCCAVPATPPPQALGNRPTIFLYSLEKVTVIFKCRKKYSFYKKNLVATDALGSRTLHPRAVPPDAFPPWHFSLWIIPSLTFLPLVTSPHGQFPPRHFPPRRCSGL